MNDKKTKTVHLDSENHRKLKIKAAEEDKLIGEIANKILKEGLKND